MVLENDLTNIQKKLNSFSLNFNKEIENLFNDLIYSNNEISNEEFDELNIFFKINDSNLSSNVYNEFPERYLEIKDSILANNYSNFLKLIKPRLLIVGLDLKFIKSAIKYLESDYDVKIDDWTGRALFDTKPSEEPLKWADIVFCEWMLEYCGWFSKNIAKHQKMFIRAHKYEISLQYGYSIDFNNVEGVITINYFFLELFSNVFNIPREKMILLNNFVETDIYSGEKEDDFTYNLAIVGYTPIWKGYRRGLQILKNLKEKDDKFKLYLMGKDYTDLAWAVADPVNKTYFESCEEFIKENNLEDSVIKCGWIDREKMFSNIGYVLSVSDVEGSHVSPSEGFADSTIGLFVNWEGVDYVYPEEFIFDNLNDISDFILNTYKDENNYQKLANGLKDYAENEFSKDYFINNLIAIFEGSSNDFSIDNLFNSLKNNYNNLANLINDYNSKNSYLLNIVKEYNSMKRLKFLKSDNLDDYMLSNDSKDIGDFIFNKKNNFKDLNDFDLIYDFDLISIQNALKESIAINSKLIKDISEFNSKKLDKLASKYEDIKDLLNSKADLDDPDDKFTNLTFETERNYSFYHEYSSKKYFYYIVEYSDSLNEIFENINILLDKFESIKYSNKKLVLLVSPMIKNSYIKNIYLKYASKSVFVYSIAYIKDYYLANLSIRKIEFFHKEKIDFKPFYINNSVDNFMVLDKNFDLEKVNDILSNDIIIDKNILDNLNNSDKRENKKLDNYDSFDKRENKELGEEDNSDSFDKRENKKNKELGEEFFNVLIPNSQFFNILDVILYSNI